MFVSRKPIPQFMKLGWQELCITSEKLMGIIFTGLDQWLKSYLPNSKEGSSFFFHLKIYPICSRFGECAVLCINWLKKT